jgi:hypothetical protein
VCISSQFRPFDSRAVEMIPSVVRSMLQTRVRSPKFVAVARLEVSVLTSDKL